MKLLNIINRKDTKYSSNTANYQIIHGNCIEVIKGLSIDPTIIFADPPFNIKQDYVGYNDNLTSVEYENFTNKWIKSCENILKNGILAIHCSDELVKLILNTCTLPRIAWIIWHYRFGQHNHHNWINSKAHCLIFGKGTWKWNPEQILVDSDRQSIYNDHRTQQTTLPGKRVPLDVWGIPSDGPYWGRIQGNNKERRHLHPNQLPEVYLERLIKAYSNEGDLILDPFAGSGTTIVVGLALKRKCIGIEISKPYCQSIEERIRIGSVRVRRS